MFNVELLNLAKDQSPSADVRCDHHCTIECIDADQVKKNAMPTSTSVSKRPSGWLAILRRRTVMRQGKYEQEVSRARLA